MFEYIASPLNLQKWTGASKDANKKSSLLVTPNAELKIGLATKINQVLGVIDAYGRRS